jgi:hypothetical protein
MDQPEDTTTFGTVLSSEGCGGAPIGRIGDDAGRQGAVAQFGS